MENLNLIRNIAWKFNEKTGLDYKELFSEAALHYCEAVLKYDETRGAKLTSFAYMHMYCELINYCKKEKRIESRILTEEQWPEDFEPLAEEPQTELQEIIQNWPKECQEVVHMVLDDPEKYLAATPNFRRFGIRQHRRLNKVKKDLKKQGWDDIQIQRSCLRIRRNLSNI